MKRASVTSQLQSFVASTVRKPSRLGLIMIGVAGLILTMSTVLPYQRQFTLHDRERQLLGTSSVDQRLLKTNKATISYASADTNAKSIRLAGAETPESSGNYSATIDKSGSKRITFNAGNEDLSISMTPRFAVGNAKSLDGHVVFDQNSKSAHVYTFKSGGLKEDILLQQSPGDTVRYEWDLDTGKNVTARLEHDGSIGFYTADPRLFAKLDSADQQSRDLIASAKLRGKRTYLAFSIPKPFIKETNGSTSTKGLAYSLKNNILSLTAAHMNKRTYPLTIDPTLTLTSTADFRSGTDDGMLGFATAGQLNRQRPQAGPTNTFTAGTTMPAPARSGHTAIAANGYLYIMGGLHATNDTACNSTASLYCSDVLSTPIDAAGNLGAWSSTTSFPTARAFHSSFVYNGYIYVLGGTNGTILGDVQYALLCDTTNNGVGGCTGVAGKVGTWSATTSLALPRENQTTNVYNGFVYVAGGQHATASTACSPSSSTFCNDVLYAPINATGTIGAWTATTSFSVPRHSHATTILNGFLYLAGGLHATSDTLCGSTSGTVCSDVQYAPLRPDGTVGTWQSGTEMSAQRYGFSLLTSRSNVYAFGGIHTATDTSCSTTSDTHCNITSYVLINTDGSMGGWSNTTSFTTPRSYAAAAYYDMFFYVTGGSSLSSPLADVQQTSYVLTGYPTAGGIGFDGQGTVSTSGGSKVVTGTGTNFLTNFQPGDKIVINGRVDHTVATVNSDTSITATGTYSSAGGGLTYKYFGHGSDLPVGLDSFGYTAYNGYLYVIGGQDGTNYQLASVYFAPICTPSNVGSLGCSGTSGIGTWAATTSLPAARAQSGAFGYNGYLYNIGGTIPSSFNYAPDTSYALICTGSNSGVGGCGATAGSIGTWLSTTSSITKGFGGFSTVVHDGYVFIIAGANDDGGIGNTLSYSALICDGTNNGVSGCNASIGNLGTWNSLSAFPNSRGSTTATTSGGYIYLIGGSLTTDQSYMSEVDYVLICNGSNSGTDGCGSTAGTYGTWHTTTSLPANNAFGESFAMNGYVYLLNNYLDSGNGGYFWYALQCNGSNSGTGGCTSTPGTLGTWSASTTGLNHGADAPELVAADGMMYSAGGFNVNGYPAATEFSKVASPAFAAHYDVLADIGSVPTTLTSFAVQGTAPCGFRVNYATAGSTGVFSAVKSLGYVVPGNYYFVNVAAQRYMKISVTLDDVDCGDNSSITAIVVNYTGNNPPGAPTLIVPATSATNVSVTPQFQLRAADAEANYLRYKIVICSDSACANTVRTIDQNLSQTGWSGQDQQTGTAYTGSATLSSSTIATHTYQAPALANLTQYWWQAFALDPAGANIFGSASSTGSFTTAAANVVPTAPTLISPLASQFGQPTTPQFVLSATDGNGDDLQYKIDICSVSDCSVIVRTVNQTSSQTGWLSQAARSNTAYASGAQAVYQYQPAGLTPGGVYWWRAYAIDPGGGNTFGPASAIQSFFVATSSVELRGGTTLNGGTTLYN